MIDDFERDITYQVTYRVIHYHRATIKVTHAEDVAHRSTAEAIRRKVALRNDPTLDRLVFLDSFKEIPLHDPDNKQGETA